MSPDFNEALAAMKHKLVITLSNRCGSRDFVISPRKKFLIVALCIGFLCVMVVCSLKAAWALSSLGETRKQLLTLHGNNLTYADQVVELRQELGSKNAELKRAEQGLEMVTRLVDEDGSLSGDGSVSVRLNSTVQELMERKFLLSAVPNGYPIKASWKISSGFGRRLHPTLRHFRRHDGIDFTAVPGTPVYATASGVVSKAITGGASGYGKQVVVQHGLGFSSRYAHLNSMSVKSGDYVVKGALLGRSGNSGRSSGPHLHYEIRYRDTALDPVNFTQWSGANFEKIFSKEKRVPWASLRKESSHWLRMASLPFLQKAAL